MGLIFDLNIFKELTKQIFLKEYLIRKLLKYNLKSIYLILVLINIKALIYKKIIYLNFTFHPF